MNPETPFTVALSRDEMIALIRFHVSRMKAIPKRLGQESLKIAASSPFPRSRDLKALHAVAQKAIDYHARRGRGIHSILEASKPD